MRSDGRLEIRDRPDLNVSNISNMFRKALLNFHFNFPWRLAVWYYHRLFIQRYCSEYCSSSFSGIEANVCMRVVTCFTDRLEKVCLVDAQDTARHFRTHSYS
jgi:hypothetical protein